MITVRVIKNWKYPDIFRQTPEHSGIWDDIYFTQNEMKECDYVIVSNLSTQKMSFLCPRENVWVIHQEPPNEYFQFFQKRQASIYAKIFTTNPNISGKKIIHTQPALPWHVDCDYDFLLQYKPHTKPLKLSWITSSKTDFIGHRDRIHFLNKLRNNLQFDLFGRGFVPLRNKWDGLVPYRYSLAIENYSGKFYWSEKLADCFLAWTMPLYYGCTNMSDYFPKESFAWIDIKDPHVFKQIRSVVDSDLWVKNRDAISYARNLILKKYQFFPFMTSYIREVQEEHNKKCKKEIILLPDENSLFGRLAANFQKLIAYA